MRAEEFLLQTGCVKWFKSGEEEKEKREKFRRLLPREGVTYQKRSTVIITVVCSLVRLKRRRKSEFIIIFRESLRGVSSCSCQSPTR